MVPVSGPFLARLRPAQDGDPEWVALWAGDASSALSLLEGALGAVELDSLMDGPQFELPPLEQGLVDSVSSSAPMRWTPGPARPASSGRWVAFVVVQPGPLSPFDPQLRQGCLRVFTAATRPQESLAQMAAALAEVHCKVLAVDWLVDAAGSAWATAPDPAQQALLLQAQDTGRAVLGRFHLWEEEEEAVVD